MTQFSDSEKVLTSSPNVDLGYVDETVARIGRGADAVIPILQAMQEHYGYLPQLALQRVCDSTQITPAAIAGVSSFYDMFRHKPVGKYIVRVCRGTACHVTGAERVEDALRRELEIPAGNDTDNSGRFTIEPVACLGCCTLAPVVKMGKSTFGHATAEKAPKLVTDYVAQNGTGHEHSTEELGDGEQRLHEIKIGLGSCCMAKGSDQLYHALRQAVADTGVNVSVKRVGCVGMCHRTPLIEVGEQEKHGAFYTGLGTADVRNLLMRHFRPAKLSQRFKAYWTRSLDRLLVDEAEEKIASAKLQPRDAEVSAFLDRQVHIATEQFGNADPLDLDEYIKGGGFSALRSCLEGAVQRAPLKVAPDKTVLTPEQLIDTIEKSGLRGRGGAGFPTGAKWRLARKQSGDTKYVICNGDEGDPGAFMDRMLLESFPFRIIEGLAVAAIACGAHDGIFYVRHEYPLAVQRVRAAIKLCARRGWLGEKLLGHDYPLRLSIKEGAGAFVCGEETALIASIEGKRGMPRLRPPFPVEAGLWEKPTIINNVETLALVPWILRNGADAFAKYGTANSKGTKVFALAGNVQRGGLIEIPMGTTIRQIVEEIGGGVAPGRRFKAVQIGGPSGGCVPASLADTPVDYESLRDVGAIMGSGGLVVLDDSACMVDIARYFLQFTQNQSCGKCTFCRIGTRRMLDILERLCAGKGQKTDLAELERLGRQVGAGSLCGLGKTAPNPVLTTLKYFRDEYEAHIQGRCPAGKCSALIKYRVRDNCTGCTICAQRCPVDAIPMTPYRQHEINMDLCIRCDTCRQVCPHDAVEVV
jgi:NADH:ubiquinone oxidoreductase subunit F (NADH-binding)/NADH:ubiquinone oxidoreductase subunit E/Pyruvate/2-oxoacid:ferredoxin oxidoreductase delta subunit